MAPADRWEKGAFLPRTPESLEQLDLLLLTVAKGRKVRNDGIHFLGLRYVDATLAAYVGESVTLRYDPRDVLKQINIRDNRHAEEIFTTHDWLSEPMPKLKPTYAAISRKYAAKEKCIDDPTQLILVDEADRLKMASLEQMRAIFDAGGIGLVLIGVSGLGKAVGPIRSVLFAHRVCP